jgi:predicted ester cyclase
MALVRGKRKPHHPKAMRLFVEAIHTGSRQVGDDYNRSIPRKALRHIDYFAIGASVMDIEANKNIVLRYFLESHNEPYNLDVIDGLWSKELVEEHKRWLQMEQAAFPDKHFTIEDVVAEGDNVVLRWTFRGTHLGEFWTPAGMVQPTGKHTTINSMAIYRLKDGKIVSADGVHDWLKLLQQFGAEVRLPAQVT